MVRNSTDLNRFQLYLDPGIFTKKMMRKPSHPVRRLPVILTGIALCIVLLVFPQTALSEPDSMEQVTLQLKWLHQFQFAGYYAAKEKGFYQEEGLDVDIQQRDLKKNNIYQVLDGEAEYGIADSLLLVYRMQGDPVVLLAPIFQHSPLVLIAPKDSGIEKPYQIKGKRIMLVPSSDMLPLETRFHEIGIKRGDYLTIAKTVNCGTVGKGIADVYTGYLTSEPYYFQEKSIKINIIDPKNYGVDFYGDMLFTSQTELEKHPDRVERFLRASLKGWKYALENTEELIDIILRDYGAEKSRDHLRYEAEAIRQIIKPEQIEIGELDIGRLHHIARNLKRQGVTNSEEVPKDFYYRRPSKPAIELTEKEMRWLHDHKIVRVTNATDWPPFDFAENGIAKGYSIDLLNLIADKVGLRLEYEIDTPLHVQVNKGKNKELDLFAAIWKTEEREEFLNFSTPYIDTPHILVVHENENRFNTMDDMRGHVVAGVKGYASTELVQKNFLDIQVVEVESALEGLRLVSYGKVDAFLGNRGDTDFHIKAHLITNVKITGEVILSKEYKVSGLHMASRKDWPELSGIIQKALDSITLEEKLALQTKWLGFDLQQKAIVFSKEEKAWLKEHPVLRVAFDVDWPPVEFAGKDGKIEGIVGDYLKRMSQLLGIRFESASPRSWQEMFTLVRNGELDFFSAVAPRFERKTWLDFTEAYLSFPLVIITNKDVPYYIWRMDDLAGNQLAVVDTYASHNLLSTHHPELPLHLVPNVKEGLMAVVGGEAFAFIGNLATVSYIIEREGLTNLKVSGQTPYTLKVSMAVPKDKTIILICCKRGWMPLPLKKSPSSMRGGSI